MPSPLSITSATLTSLKVGTTDSIKFALLLEKTPGNPAQVVDLSDFGAAYGYTDDQVAAAIRTLESAKALKSVYDAFTINWTSNPSTSNTAAQLQSDWNNRVLDDPTYYVYQALALNKTAAMAQTVDPADYAVAPWNIPVATFITEVQALASRRPTGAASSYPTPFTVDFAGVTLTWIADDIGSAA